MTRSWSMPLRGWLAVALIAVVVVPLAAWVGIVLAVRGPAKLSQTPWQRQSQTALREAVALLQDGRDRWTQPGFQQELTALLESGGYAAVLMDGDGRPFFRYGTSLWDDTPAPDGRIASVYGDQHHLGIVRNGSGEIAGMYLLVRTREDPLKYLVLYSIALGIIAAVGGSVWWVGRSIGRPLKGLAGAAQQINRGTLAFDLPASRVAELNELSAAFAAMRDSLRTSIFRQAEMEQERRMLIAAVAHDLRTPLTSVRGYLEGLRDGVANTPEKVERYVRVALEKTEHLQRLTESLFAYARSEYLKADADREEMRLDLLLRSVAESFRPRAEAAAITLAVTAGEPCVIAGDRLMLERVVDNLLDNALRHTPRGGAVTVGWNTNSDAVSFWVQDTGPGIPESDLTLIFEPLYRADKARGSRTGGAGLGLTIARRLLTAHGGAISAANKEGARFTVTLPVR